MQEPAQWGHACTAVRSGGETHGTGGKCIPTPADRDQLFTTTAATNGEDQGSDGVDDAGGSGSGTSPGKHRQPTRTTQGGAPARFCS